MNQCALSEMSRFGSSHFLKKRHTTIGASAPAASKAHLPQNGKYAHQLIPQSLASGKKDATKNVENVR